jgi:hypothetical protein
VLGKEFVRILLDLPQPPVVFPRLHRSEPLDIDPSIFIGSSPDEAVAAVHEVGISQIRVVSSWTAKRLVLSTLR